MLKGAATGNLLRLMNLAAMGLFITILMKFAVTMVFLYTISIDRQTATTAVTSSILQRIVTA